ncbi:cytochrome P450 [Rhodococcus sp. NPDC003318]|uniref:cytochrome P450 n=1 Tax=Rhodococcus sp. NPDC003318 TaxID=3364503 RepID=UPI0036938F89
MAQPLQCPVSHNDYSRASEIYGHYALLDAERERDRFHFNDTTEHGFWMLTRYEDVLAGFQNSTALTTDVRTALFPKSGIPLLPQDLNGEEHQKFRKIINRFFAPAAVKRMAPLAHSRCIELIEEIRDHGHCNFVAEFAIRYPTDLFLALLGLPVSDGEFFLPWSENMLNCMLQGDVDGANLWQAKILDYFDRAVEERRTNPLDPAEDLVTRLLQAEIDGVPLSKDDILTTCLSIMLAGLDTTRSALGYIFAHLAQHDEDRQMLIDDPGLTASAVEEFVRLYPLVIQAGREVKESTEVHGLDLAPDDVVWLGIGSANRDPRMYPEPEKFVLGRPGLNQHLAFGAGPHRCLGMHLARLELAVVLEEWHKRIPHYRIKSGAPLVERGSQLTLENLELEWEV